MSSNHAFERFFESVSRTSDAIMTAVLDQNERQFRLSGAVLLEMQRSQHEDFEIARRFAENPADIGGIYRLMVETASRRQGRALEFGRELLTTVGESTSGARNTAREVLSMQREAAEAATETASRAVNSAVETVRENAGATAGAATRNVGAEAERIAEETVREAGATAGATARAAQIASAANAAASPKREVVHEPTAAHRNRGSANGRTARSGRTHGGEASARRAKASRRTTAATQARNGRDASRRRKRDERGTDRVSQAAEA